MASPALADNTVQANADVWISDLSGQEGTNFEGSVNPSTQLRNAGTVRRIGLYEFTLPEVGAYETVTGVEFRVEEFFGGSDFIADFGLLNANPGLGSITYNSAVADGYVIAGNDANANPVIGPNTMLAGETWTVVGGTGTLQFVDSNSFDGFAQLIKNAAGPSPQTVTLMLTPVDTTAGATVGGFFGRENGESNVFFPHPRLTIRKQLTVPTHEVQANADTYIASNAANTAFEGSVNPSTILRNNSSVTRATFYSFTLPQLAAGQSIEGVQFDLIAFADGSHFSADFALLTGNPDLSTITWNSAIADGFITGLDGSFNPILGVNATAVSELWEAFGDNADGVRFTDGDASDGLAQLIASAASTAGPVDITLMMVTRGQADLGNAYFYGSENGEGGGFTPHPRLRLTIIPEPASLALVGVGALMMVRRRGHARTPRCICD